LTIKGKNKSSTMYSLLLSEAELRKGGHTLGIVFSKLIKYFTLHYAVLTRPMKL